jgi:outer membrane receptor protein involved in Fe transport
MKVSDSRTMNWLRVSISAIALTGFLCAASALAEEVEFSGPKQAPATVSSAPAPAVSTAPSLEPGDQPPAHPPSSTAATSEPSPDTMSAVATESSAETIDVDLAELLKIVAVSASKKEESTDVAPNVVFVVTRDQIRKRGIRNLRDLLMTIPGFTVLHRDLTYVAQVRGIAANTNDKVSLLLNGVNLKGVNEDNYLTDLINLDNVQRVEVIVGPGSVLYGAETLAAIINIITPESNDSEVILGAGNDDKRSATASVGKSFGKGRNIFLSATYAKMDGFDAFSDTAHTNSAWDPLKGTKVFGRLNPSLMLIGKGTWDDWSIQCYSSNNSIPESYIYTTAPGDRGDRIEYIDHIVATHNRQWLPTLSTNTSLGYFNRRMFRGLDYKGNTTSPGQMSFDYTQTSYRIEPSIQWRPRPNNYFQAGLLVEDSLNRHNYNFNWDPNNWGDPRYNTGDYSVTSALENRDTYATGMYLSDEHDVSEDIKLVGAIRADHNTILNSTGWFLSPRVAAIYRAASFLRLKLMYNTATHFPSPNESNMVNDWNLNNPVHASWIVNPPTEQPERMTAYEIQTIWSILEKHRISVNGYWQELRNFISWSSPNTNVGDFKGWGGELSYMGQLFQGFQAWGGATYAKAKFYDAKTSNSALGLVKSVVNSAGDMMSVPKATVVLGIDWRILPDVTLAPQMNYLYKMPTSYARDGKTTEMMLDHRIYLNATLTWTNAIVKGLTLQAIGKNLTNDREILPMQFQTSTYTPRGLTAEGVASYRF